MTTSDKQEMVDNIAKVIAKATEPQIAAAAAVVELERFAKFEPPINEPTPLSSGPTLTAIRRAEEVRQRATHFAALVIKAENYVDVLRKQSGLDLSFVENRSGLIDKVERR
jgi:hypothetical protein